MAAGFGACYRYVYLCCVQLVPTPAISCSTLTLPSQFQPPSRSAVQTQIEIFLTWKTVNTKHVWVWVCFRVSVWCFFNVFTIIKSFSELFCLDLDQMTGQHTASHSCLLPTEAGTPLGRLAVGRLGGQVRCWTGQKEDVELSFYRSNFSCPRNHRSLHNS